MNNNIANLTLIPVAALLCCTLFLAPCSTTSSQLNTSQNSGSATSSEATRQFYHAWLADCINDLWYIFKERAVKKLQAKAKERIDAASKNKTIIDSFGKEELVWGPAIMVSDDGHKEYVSSNLIYCLKSTDNGVTSYHIGIAGTNMISMYDWMAEDLNVHKVVNWRYGGNVSQGSLTGFKNLAALKDPETRQTLADFLRTEIGKSSRSINVSVSGHSLGGALTQVYSSYLKNTLNHENIQVKAWVYAGPTAGDQVFAETLVNQLDSYNAYNNTLDVVPHAWQADRLNKLCNIYEETSICGSTTANNPTVNGVIKYLRDISDAHNYTMPGNPITFTGENLVLHRAECSQLNTILEGLWLTGSHTKLNLNLNNITKQCDGGTEFSKTEFFNYFYYMTEMGYQHTTAYLDHFIKNDSLKKVINKYVPGENSLLNVIESKHILEAFLGKISNHLMKKGVKNCTCDS